MCANEIRVITSADSPLKAISQTELASIFLKRKSKIQGQEIQVIQYRANSIERIKFARKILNMSMDEETLYWRKQLVQKGIRPPKSKKNALIVKKYLARHPFTISYLLDKSDLDDTVVEIQVTN